MITISKSSSQELVEIVISKCPDHFRGISSRDLLASQDERGLVWLEQVNGDSPRGAGGAREYLFASLELTGSDYVNLFEGALGDVNIGGKTHVLFEGVNFRVAYIRERRSIG